MFSALLALSLYTFFGAMWEQASAHVFRFVLRPVRRNWSAAYCSASGSVGAICLISKRACIPYTTFYDRGKTMELFT